MNADQVVQRLLGNITLNESDAAEFVQSMPPETWDTFLILNDGQDGIRAEHGYRQHSLVFKNNKGGLMDFIGYIVLSLNNKWYPSGVRGSRGTEKLPWEDMKADASYSPNEAATKLMAIFRRTNSNYPK